MIQEAEYKEGDTVSLNTGGPEMTVTATNDIARIAFCKWFHAGDLQHGEFPFRALRRVAASPPAGNQAPTSIYGILSIVLPTLATAIGLAYGVEAAHRARGTLAFFAGMHEVWAGVFTAGILFLVFGVAAYARKEPKQWLGPVGLLLFVILAVASLALYDKL